jgi:lysozyme family protein
MGWLINLLKTLARIPKMESKPTPQPVILPISVKIPNSISELVPPIDIFPEALPFILAKEGGYTNHPADRGGPTNKGVIQREYDAYREEKGLLKQSVQFIGDAEVSDIYRNKYWNAGKCPAMPRRIAIVHFDTCINCGVRQAGKFLQRAIKCPVVDGIVGNDTIRILKALLKTTDEVVTIHSYLEQRSEFYYGLIKKDPSQLVFIKGWQNRLRDLAKFIKIETDTAV